MKKIIFIILIILLPFGLWATDIYVDPTCAAGSAYNKTTRAQGTGSDISYQTIQAAITGMSGGDDIYIRGGTYQEHDILIPASKTGTAENWSSLRSYPGEWGTEMTRLISVYVTLN